MVVVFIIKMVAVHVRPPPIQTRLKPAPYQFFMRQRQAHEILFLAALDIEKIRPAILALLHAAMQRSGQIMPAAPLPVSAQAQIANFSHKENSNLNRVS